MTTIAVSTNNGFSVHRYKGGGLSHTFYYLHQTHHTLRTLTYQTIDNFETMYIDLYSLILARK